MNAPEKPTIYTAKLSGHGIGDILGQLSFDILSADEPFFWRVPMTPEWSSWLHLGLFNLLWRAGLFTRMLVSIEEDWCDWADCLRRSQGIDAEVKEFHEHERLTKLADGVRNVQGELRRRFSFLPSPMPGDYSTIHYSSAAYAADKHLTRKQIERHFIPSSRCFLVGSPVAVEIIQWLKDRYRHTEFIQRTNTTLAEYLGLLKGSQRHLATASNSGLWTAQFGIQTTIVFGKLCENDVERYARFYRRLSWCEMVFAPEIA